MSDQTISEALEEVIAECSRLRGELNNANDKKNYWKTNYYWSKEDVERLRERVEELKRDGKELGETFENLLRSKGHHITDEQIDAAVDRIECGLLTKVAKIVAWAALNKLNIYRCEGCGGEGITRQYPHGEPVEPCPDCNGKGYTLGVKDE